MIFFVLPKQKKPFPPKQKKIIPPQVWAGSCYWHGVGGFVFVFVYALHRTLHEEEGRPGSIRARC
jgi:hypothetical protein